MEQEMIHIHFIPNVTSGTVTPSTPQYGGVQGDRNAALLSFLVPESLRGEQYCYRIEGVDGAGGFVTTETLPIDDEHCVATLLDERFTAAGGQILVRLVVSEIQGNNEIAVVRSFDGRVFFADAPTPLDASAYRDALSALVFRADQKAEQMDAVAEMLTERVGELSARSSAVETALINYRNRLTAAENSTDELDSRLEDISDDLSNFKGAAERKEEESTPWRFIQKIVRAGLAEKMFSVGDVFPGIHSEYGLIEWEVIGFDHETLVADEYSHSMTLQAKNCLHHPNGTYDLKAYDTQDSTHIHGQADWEMSDLRAWLNSTERANQWGAYGENDTPPAYHGQDGFMRGLSDSFLEAIGTVETKTALYSPDSNETATCFDKIFLPAKAEVYGGVFGNGVVEGTPYEKYNATHSALRTAGNGADQNRIKKLNGVATSWWLRSVNATDADKVLQIKNTGAINSITPDTACAVAPACCIY